MMKKIYASLSAIVLFVFSTQAQSPQRFNYQAIARDAAGNAVPNRNVHLRMSIIDSVATGPVPYQETFSVTTDAGGLFSIAIGGGTVSSGSFAAINWGHNNKFLRTEMDINGGSNYVVMGTSQFLSVPYALYSLKSADASAAWTVNGNDIYSSNSGNVGIGTTTPQARLHVQFGSTLITGLIPINLPASPGLPPGSGAGSRQFWYYDKSAFRTGGVDDGSYGTTKFSSSSIPNGNHFWDKDSIGQFSLAAGYNVLANGVGSASIGAGNRAMGNASFAAGLNNIVNSYGGAALGEGNSVVGNNSYALGLQNSITSNLTTVIGSNNFVGDQGSSPTLSAGNFVLGNNNFTEGSENVLIGNRANNPGWTGCVMITDNSFGAADLYTPTADNQFVGRFSGGYFLYTGNIHGHVFTGVQLLPTDNAWSSISDSTKKSDFVTADGEQVLQKLETFRNLGSWSYKGQDPKKFRHYGPMAQEFHSAFGNDGIGISGNDTLINSADLSGVLFIAMHAMTERTRTTNEKLAIQQLTINNQQLAVSNLTTENAQLKKEMSSLKEEYANANESLNARNAALEKKLALLDAQLSKLTLLVEVKNTSEKVSLTKK